MEDVGSLWLWPWAGLGVPREEACVPLPQLELADFLGSLGHRFGFQHLSPTGGRHPRSFYPWCSGRMDWPCALWGTPVLSGSLFPTLWTQESWFTPWAPSQGWLGDAQMELCLLLMASLLPLEQRGRQISATPRGCGGASVRVKRQTAALVVFFSLFYGCWTKYVSPNSSVET